jgi:DNA helicase-2/ATP-dependent DNA helicase PcrA
MPEHRLFGPPGTGKTTQLTHWIQQTAQRHGSDCMMVASFTRAAAAELGGRKLPIAHDRIGTLHSHAFRAIGRAEIAEKTLCEEWNRKYPNWELSAGLDSDDVIESWGKTDGDKLFHEAQVNRARMIPLDEWINANVARFHIAWTQFKEDTSSIDFTDMIEIALRDVERAPNDPKIGFFDEAQDFTLLELSLIRKWAQHMENVVLAGDDDQCIYRFKGATPDAFLDPPVDDAHKRVLQQSYRVPYLVQLYAQRWIESVTRREPKVYAPRQEDGAVRFVPELNLGDIERVIYDAERYIADGKRVMFLAACSYMIDPLKWELRKQGIPFHNPYRRTRGDWNPLRASRGTSASERVLAFIAPQMRQRAPITWSGEEMSKWTHLLKAEGVMQRGAKAKIQAWAARQLMYDDATLAAMFTDDAREHMEWGDLVWLEQHALANSLKSLQFPLTIARKQGPKALEDDPRVILGTIHSVKGGEADVVYVFPDLSNAGFIEWNARGELRDSVIRQFYVAMTRARETLVICGEASRYWVDLPQALPGRKDVEL